MHCVNSTDWKTIISLYFKMTTQASTVLSEEQQMSVSTHHFHIAFIVEGLSKDGHDKDVDEERDEERDT